MANWKKITNKSKIGGMVYVKTEGNVIRDDIYSPVFSHERDRWEFIDSNCVTCREWNGEPTHYKLVNT